MKKAFSRYTLFIGFLPVFFVLHGFTENYDLVPVRPSLFLLAIYLAVSLGIFLLFRLLFRNNYKAGLMSFCIIAYHFFFGSLQDIATDWFPGSFITRYIFILPVSCILFVSLFIYLKKSKKQFQRSTLYLNSLFGLLLLLDTGWLVSKIAGRRMSVITVQEELIPCNNCPHPDIYLLVADGYPGKTQLRDILGYDNSAFEEELKKRGFHITDNSLANYNFTFFSMGSVLNMNYLKNVSGSIQDKKNIPLGSKALKNSQVLNFLEKEGYTFFNHSLFDFKNKPTLTKPTFWINDTRPLTSQTFLSRLKRDLGYHLVTKFKLKMGNSYPIDQDLHNNDLLYAETIKIAATKTSTPKFVYTHLIMPHHPYYFDSLGNKTDLQNLTKEFAFNKAAATSYILYANKKYLSLIDTIIASSTRPPLILLISDHGFREITENKDKKTMFLNLNAVLFPGKEYGGFYPGMSNVNLFRVILNTQFKQRLTLIKDSTIFLAD
jgi:hypothetical protein